MRYSRPSSCCPGRSRKKPPPKNTWRSCSTICGSPMRDPPRPRLAAVRVVDMTSSNSWAELATTFRRTRSAFQEHEGAKAELKKLVPEDAKEAMGHGLRANRSKSGAISFDPVEMETDHAPLQ